MKFFYKKRFIKRIAFATLIILLIGVVLVFVIVPIIFRYSYTLQSKLLFLNFVKLPIDYKNPAKYDLQGARNLYLNSTDGVALGIWHVLPLKKLPNLLAKAVISGETSNSSYDAWLGEGDPIFIYAHGNSMSRGATHRLELYRILQKENFHVIAFDYRGYGDSSPVEPSENGLVKDTELVYRWVKERARGSKIFFWGHSLGTGVSSHALDVLESQGEKLAGLVLEAPFNNLKDAIRSYPLAKIFHILPWFDFFFVDPVYDNGLQFESDKHLSRVKTPISILHAEDDFVIPFKLGKKLYETLQKERGSNQLLQFKKFKKELHRGHKHIYKDDTLPEIIRSFVKESIEYKRP